MAENREYQKAIDYLCGLIERKEITIGDRLPTERAISEKLSIGRNSTREALKMLEKLGFVKSIQGSGNYLTANMSGAISSFVEMMMLLNQTSQAEMMSFRRQLDMTICREIISGNTVPRWENKFREIIEIDWDQLTREEQIELDKRVHYLIIHASENSLWICIAEAIASIYNKWIDSTVAQNDNERQKFIHGLHCEVLNGLLEGDVQRCEKALVTHYALAEGE